MVELLWIRLLTLISVDGVQLLTKSCSFLKQGLITVIHAFWWACKILGTSWGNNISSSTPFYSFIPGLSFFSAYSAENHACMSGFKYKSNLPLAIHTHPCQNIISLHCTVVINVIKHVIKCGRNWTLITFTFQKGEQLVIKLLAIWFIP